MGPITKEVQRRVRGSTATRAIVYGSRATPIKRTDSAHTHAWSVYVRGVNGSDLTHFIRRVVFKLHDSFANPSRICDSPPFEVSETGWGEFEVLIKIHFVDPAEKCVQIILPLKLYPMEGVTIQKGSDVISEHYEEIVFHEPSESFYDVLIANEESVVAAINEGVPNGDIDYAGIESRELTLIDEGRIKIKEQITSYQARLEAANAELTRLNSVSSVE